MKDVLSQLFQSREISRSTKEQYERAVRSFGHHLGREAVIQDLHESNVNAWVAHLEARGLSPCSRKNMLRGLLCVWNFAASLCLCDPYRRPRLRKVKQPSRIIVAPSSEAVSQLIAAAEVLTGRIGGISAKIYASAYVRTAVDTMLRPSDMRRLEWEWLAGSSIRVVQSKTGKFVARPLRNETVEALQRFRDACGARSGVMFPLSKYTWRDWEARMREGIEGFGPGVSLGHLRHAGATSIDRKHGMQAASAALGHVPGSQMAPRFYVENNPERMAPLPFDQSGADVT